MWKAFWDTSDRRFVGEIESESKGPTGQSWPGEFHTRVSGDGGPQFYVGTPFDRGLLSSEQWAKISQFDQDGLGDGVNEIAYMFPLRKKESGPLFYEPEPRWDISKYRGPDGMERFRQDGARSVGFLIDSFKRDVLPGMSHALIAAGHIGGIVASIPLYFGGPPGWALATLGIAWNVDQLATMTLTAENEEPRSGTTRLISATSRTFDPGADEKVHIARGQNGNMIVGATIGTAQGLYGVVVIVRAQNAAQLAAQAAERAGGRLAENAGAGAESAASNGSHPLSEGPGPVGPPLAPSDPLTRYAGGTRPSRDVTRSGGYRAWWNETPPDVVPASVVDSLPRASLSDLFGRDLTAVANRPGTAGVTVTDSLISNAHLWRLTQESGGLEYILTREIFNVEGRGVVRVYRLYSGEPGRVRMPRLTDTRYVEEVAHTHPQTGGIVDRFPSDTVNHAGQRVGDIPALEYQYQLMLQRNPNAPVPRGRIVFGPGEKDSTTYFPQFPGTGGK